MSDVINAHDLGVAGGYIIEAAMQRVIDQLKAENAELRERIHELEMEGSDHFYRTAYAEDANRTLETENAKLRELVLDMYKQLLNAYDPKELDEFSDRMRELGIEVPE